MVDTDLLLFVVIGELVLLAALLLTLVIRSALVAFREPRRRDRIRAAESDLIAAINSDRETSYPFARLRRPEQVEVIFDLLSKLSGDSQGKLATIANESGIAGLGLRWCRSRRWYMRVRGVAVLSVLGVDGPVVEMLGDRRPEVRIRAAEWAADRHDGEVLRALCLMLGDPDPGVRFTVVDCLLRIGGPAVDPLRRVIEEEHGPATTAAALRVASGIGDHRLAEPALARCTDRRPEVRAAAASATGTLGGSAASEKLVGLLADPEPEVRLEAVNSLRRMNAWNSAPDVARLLADPAWPVRRATAIALDGFGPIGRLFIRRIARGEPGVASEVATQALGPSAPGGPA